MNPPLRGVEDVKSMKESLANGVLDCIATDHAPHHESEKNNGLLKAMNGIVGLETSAALSITELVETGILTPLELVRKMSTNPAQVLGIDKGSLQVR
jgi:dihydroorotase